MRTTRMNLSLTEMVALGTIFSGIAAWGFSVESRAHGIEEDIQAKVDHAVEEAVGHVARSLFPSGAVMAYLGPDTQPPRGWEICGHGESEFPSLEGRFLVGTHHIDSVGGEVGSPAHDHGVNIRSTGEVNGHNNTHPEGADNWTGDPNWFHRHNVQGLTASVEHTPPSIQVLFFCKQ